MKYIAYTLLGFLCFTTGAAVAHYSMPEKARLTKEQAQHLLDKKYRVMGYLHNEDGLFEETKKK